VHVAVTRAAVYSAAPCSSAQVILVGDTPRDIECARQSGSRVLAVATGAFTLEQLVACGPDAAVRDLTDAAPLEELIRRCGDA